MELLSLKNIEKTYEQKCVLNKVNLSIKEGEFFTFLGPSGCGKTTLLRIIAGFVQAEKGTVTFEGNNMTNTPAEKRNVGMVFQNYALFPFMNVFENVAYGLKNKKDSKQTILQQVTKYLKLVNLEGYEARNVSELSGGEQQRVALARSLVMQPKLLLLDEPLSNLDARLRDKMRMELKEIQSQLGITTLFVTHDQTEALTMSDRIAVFDQGNCVQVGTPYEIYTAPANVFVANFIGDTNLFKVQIENNKAVLNSTVSLDLCKDSLGEYISIRPQDITISDKTEGSLNTLSGIVKKVSMSGPLIEYIVTVEALELKVIKLNTIGAEYKRGQQVYLTLEPRCIKILNE
ncbi:ABC transporter ATP-binding protein [Fusibacter sp. 3D3]|uniref:ABC transporter ATP-binding protein n=1 Tax=Fusibacter sp. 3D3 TaxID=1048380 RepID=UPI0008529E5E|nr:ABC transporter ATP-binding protein [Fusibacter sp. 3D3]GAU79672.1 putrescine transport ATP-binding protein PotA [Fusibacter sp. 3D3]